MGEFLWTFAVQEMLKKVVRLAAKEIGLTWGLEKELSNLKEWLLKSETFLLDINTRKLHNDSVRLWVEKLHHLVHEADDLIDNLVYEHLRHKVQKNDKMNKVHNFLFPSNNSLVFRYKMAKKMNNFMNQLNKHDREATRLGLVGDEPIQTLLQSDVSQIRETVSEVDDFEVVGRDVEVSSIVKQVIDAHNQRVTSILPIVGMGGLGKTTLARLIFNHEMIKQHFDETIWVCVSIPFDINKILGAILQNVKGHDGCYHNREILLRELKKEMYGKRYFLVLDDVWNEDSLLWEQLKNFLMKITSKSGNSILVTTRNVEVCKIMEKALPTHHITKLSDEQCWSLFMESANANGLPTTSNLEAVREELVKKFGGIPLVARVLGSAVKFEQDYDIWVSLLEGVLRSPLHLQGKNFCLPILKLSVDYLPSSLKPCFAYCSNFPKDYEFRKDPLIQMWIAQGFIQLQEGRSCYQTVEEEGERYFKILLSRCLFQDVVKDARGRIISCKMHDLIHDMACDVSNDQKSLLDSCTSSDEELWRNRTKNIGSKLRMIACHEGMPHRIEKAVHDKIGSFVCLRVLIMNSRSIYKLPYSIGELKHLRYVDISGCLIQKLPKSIVLLYNLKTLRIGSSPIEELPKDLRRLVNLRHLEFSEIYFVDPKKMPPHLSQLIHLQTLSCFMVGFEKSCEIAELGPLKNLKGSLKISNLERVKSREEAKSANFMEKEKLRELVLEWGWSNETEDHSSNHNGYQVLEGLQPHKKLHSLSIHSFVGECLANNIFVDNLVAISLVDCRNCGRLPMLGHLNSLEELLVSGLNGVRSIGSEFYGNHSNQHLRVLQILECSKLTKLPNGLQFCHSIQHLRLIDNCSFLALDLQNEHLLMRLPERLAHLSELKEMDIVGCTQHGDLMNLRPVRPVIKLLSNDEHRFQDLSEIQSLPEWLENFTSLQLLNLSFCVNMKQLPETRHVVSHQVECYFSMSTLETWRRELGVDVQHSLS
ncbi:disease resistance protein RGA2-like isoform X2 [Cucurbita moschata]|uniref:Disease resistance protein RGA2-like isoform X2 n=1 Tax=Cucurbita moschata TaxID=3662 RepID=A0A6J1FYJ5_CUCMO|nr:disease resistance protein RGA2-like isoform X2 [Cucurbita moschata]